MNLCPHKLITFDTKSWDNSIISIVFISDTVYLKIEHYLTNPIAKFSLIEHWEFKTLL